MDVSAALVLVVVVAVVVVVVVVVVVDVVLPAHNNYRSVLVFRNHLQMFSLEMERAWA